MLMTSVSASTAQIELTFSGFAEVRDRGAVRVVADRAVLLHRRVVAHERPALLHVAGVAGVGDRVAHHHRRPDRAVRVVAVGAGDQAFADRVAVGPVDLGALLLVAFEAHLRLVELVANPVVRGVDLVAARAGGVAARVHAALPVDALAALVAGEARLVLGFRRRHPGALEHAVRTRPFLRVGGLVDVRLALAVAARTGGGAGVRDGAVLCLADGEDRVFLALVVAARALRVALEDEVLARRLLLRLGDGCDPERESEHGQRHGEPAVQLSHHPTSSRGGAAFPLFAVRINGCYLPSFSSWGPGPPSGSLCAMPKWQSMQVRPSALPFA
jgi:hypothetical protein